MVDTELRYLVAEGDALRAIGMRAEDFIGKTIFEALEPAVAAHHERSYRDALSGNTFAHEHAAHGRVYLSRGVPLRDSAGRIYAALVVSYDVTAQRQAEAAEKRAEEVFSTLIEGAPFGVYIVDSEFRLRALNGRAEAVFKQVEPLLGRDFADVLRLVWPEPFASEAVERFRHTLASGEPYVAPTATVERSNVARTESYDWRLQRMTLPDGTLGVVCYFYDLTPVRHAEKVLAGAARRDAFLVRAADALAPLANTRDIISTATRLLGEQIAAAQVAYGSIDDAGEFATIDRDWNDGSMQSNAGRLRLEDFGAAFISDLKRGETVVISDVRGDARTIGSALDAFCRTSIAAFMNIPLLKDGKLVAVLAVHHPTPRDWSPEEVELARDIAQRTWSAVERMRAEESLRQRTEQFETLLQRAPLGVYLVDSMYRIVEVNPTAREVFGDSPDLLGRSLDELMHRLWPPAYAAEVMGRFRHTMETGLSYVMPERVERRLDREVDEYYEWRLDRIPLPHGDQGVVCYFRDISRRKLAEEALRRSQEQLKLADRRKDEFLAVLSHELRNPLAPIRTGLDVLRMAGDTPAAIQRVRSMMERQLSHLVRLVDDLLDISRVTSGKLRLERQPTSLATLVATAIETQRAAIDAASLSLAVDLPEAPPMVEVDPTRFVQILSNLVHNAIKFSNPGGRLELSARVAHGVGHHAADPGPEVTLVISDSGAGISREMLPRVFDLFAQDETSVRPTHAGLGIGLALSKRLIEMHGGSIQAQSDGPGCGSQFVIKLPLDGQVPRPPL